MSRARADEDEYWHSSKCRAFTFDDDDDELCQVRGGAACTRGGAGAGSALQNHRPRTAP